MGKIQPVTLFDDFNRQGQAFDSFGRQRVSEPVPLISISQDFDDQPLFLNTLTANGGTSTHRPDEAASDLIVTSTIGSRVVRQSKRYGTYQPAKSLQLFLTGVFKPTASGIRSRVGYFDDAGDKTSGKIDGNGCFLEIYNDTVRLCRRSYVTGAQADTYVDQAEWNGDRLDGSGVSGVTIDWSKAQILTMDVEWLGVGGVRVGVVLNKRIYYIHNFEETNANTTTFWSSGSLPIRYEIEQIDGESAGAIKQICCSLNSEGGFDIKGKRFTTETPNSDNLTLTADESLIVAIRKKGTHNRMAVALSAFEASAISSGDILFQVYHADSDAVTVVNAGNAQQASGGSGVEYFDYTNVTAGDLTIDFPTIKGDDSIRNIISLVIANQQENMQINIENTLLLGSDIEGKSEWFILSALRRTGNQSEDVTGSLAWLELY